MGEHIDPTPTQLEDFLKRDQSAPIYMVNLLKFRARAEYPDGRDAKGLSGSDAYGLYGAVAGAKIVEVGGKLVWGAPAEMTVIGGVDEKWDAVAIVYYPTRAAFVKMVSMPDYLEATVHRVAGLERSIIVQCDGNAAFTAL